MIKLLSFSTIRFQKLDYYVGIDIIKQYLVNKGYPTTTDNFTLSLYPPDDGAKFVVKKPILYDNFDKAIPEIYQLQPIIQLIKNYQNNNDLLKDISKYFTDFEMDNIKNLIEYTNNYKIKDGDIVGLQVIYRFVFHCLLFVLQLKKSNPNKKITTVFGGYHITESKVVREFLLKFDFIDYIVIDDGRQPMLDIVKGNTKSKELKGSFVGLTYPEYIKLDRIIRKDKDFQITTTVGCPNHCRFCASHRHHILYDIEYIKRYLIRQHKIYPIKNITFVDDLINPTKERLKEICKMLLELQSKHNMKFGWEAHCYALNIDNELADLMNKTNCKSVFLGTEIFDDKILTIINKGCLSSDYKNTILKLTKKNIKTKLGIIVNLPEETREIFLSSLEKLKEINNENVIIIPSLFKLFPNCHIYRHPENYGIKIINWDQDIVDSLTEIKGMAIPKEWYYINDPSSTGKNRMNLILKYLKETESGDTYS